MKNMIMKIASGLAMLAMFSVILGTSSCKKDSEPTPDPIIVLDGIYVKGGSTALTTYDSKGMMKTTPNEVNQSARPSLMELYIAVKAGAPGFNIVKVAGSVMTTYGPGADFKVVPESERIADEPKIDFWRGSYTESTTAFTVPADGLYHVVIDTELKKVVIAPVFWGIIGAATPGGWGGSTQFTPGTFDLNTMTYQITDMVLTKADFKFRYSDGWKIVLDTTVDIGGGAKGVRVNTNYGGAVAALVPGGANIANAVPGKYTGKMTWTLGTGNTASLVKTGDLDVKDYTNTELGLVGNGLIVNGQQQTWDVTIMLSKPTVENVTTYYWYYKTVEVTTLGSFKIREGQDWNHKSIGYNDVTMSGLSADKFGTNGDGNFVPLENGIYDFELKIDAVTEKYTLTVNPAGAAPEMFMLGDGCSAGWDNTKALPMIGAGGIYYITADLTPGKNIKFITTLGQWAPMYGTDAGGTSTGGNLVYRPTESDPDPASIPTPATAGKYTITLDIANLKYTIVTPLYMLGDGCAAGWDNTKALPMGFLQTPQGNAYFIVADLTPGKNIKFITTLGQWAPMYGTNATGTSVMGPLVYRATEGDPDPASIPTPAAAGKYAVACDLVNLLYVIQAPGSKK